MNDNDLFQLALASAQRAYAPYSGFRVGAALLASDGRVFSGVNVENSSFGGTICAERTAVVKAVSEGVLNFSAIAVASPDGASSPCGICRQFLFEFGEELRVITGKDGDHLQVRTIRELLPEGFRLEKETT